MPFYVAPSDMPKYRQDGTEEGDFYHDYEWADALAAFLKAVTTEETAELRWSS